jgi:Probable sporulation protein (Bac_small_yrzI)
MENLLTMTVAIDRQWQQQQKSEQEQQQEQLQEHHLDHRKKGNSHQQQGFK